MAVLLFQLIYRTKATVDQLNPTYIKQLLLLLKAIHFSLIILKGLETGLESSFNGRKVGLKSGFIAKKAADTLSR